MTDSLYPHQSPLVRSIIGVLLFLIVFVILYGTSAGWFTPAPTPHWCTTIMPYELQPRLFGIDPYVIAPIIALIAFPIFVYGIIDLILNTGKL
jgi:hypothetical protein